MKQLPRYEKCFVCGRNNQAGLNMIFTKTDIGVRGQYTASEKHCSYEGILHGGIISALLDECIGWAVGLQKKNMFVTGELTISFKSPIPIGKNLIIEGFYSEDQSEEKKYRKGHGRITDEQGVVYATGKGTFFPTPSEINQGIVELMEDPNDLNKKITLQDIWE